MNENHHPAIYNFLDNFRFIIVNTSKQLGMLQKNLLLNEQQSPI